MPSQNRPYVELPAIEDLVDSIMGRLPAATPICLVELADAGTRRPTYTYLAVDPRIASIEPDRADETFAQIARLVPATSSPLMEDLPPFQGGFIGFVGYDDPPERQARTPRASVFYIDRLIAIDHKRRRAFYIGSRDDTETELRVRISALTNGPLESSGDMMLRPSEQWSQSPSRDGYLTGVLKAKELLRASKLAQIILSLEYSRPRMRPSFEIYRALTRANATAQNFYFRFGDFTLFGTPPSTFVQVKDGRAHLEIGAGTRGVTGDTELDDQAAVELASDPKEIREHQILLDQASEDLEACASGGSVEVAACMTVRRFSHVMHLFSELTARLSPGVSSLELARRCYPPAPATGVPRRLALDAIASIERTARGPYSGLYLMVGHDGLLSTAIIERSAWIIGGRMYLRVGAGITTDSDPAMEYAECQRKAGAILKAAED